MGIETNNVSEKAILYRNVRIKNVDIADYAVIADDCDLVDVTMASHAEFGRRNIVRNVCMGYGSYTGQNTTIRNVVIGNYCCISSDVNIYGGGDMTTVICLCIQIIGIKKLLEQMSLRTIG